MAITSKARKRLWGQSGNCCAICRRELVAEATPHDEAALLGEECHVVSGRPCGPRYDPSFPTEQIDTYSNLILLCSIHHTMVDQQPGTHTADALLKIKAAHELWVSETLRGTAQVAHPRPLWRRKRVPEYLVRLATGTELSNLILGAHGYSFSHDDLRSNEEVDLVGSFLEAAQEYGDADDFGAHHRVQVTTELGEFIEDLAHAGFFVFGGREVWEVKVGESGSEDFVVAILRVLRETNEAVIKVNLADKVHEYQIREDHHAR